MNNYYEELNLDKHLSASAINDQLDKLESVWKRREINNPEKATRMLALIIEARDVFKTETAKARYDIDLEESSKSPNAIDPDIVRKTEFEKWRRQAEAFFYKEQSDVAIEALNRALQYRDPNTIDPTFSYLASMIEAENNNYERALSFINEALLVSPEKPQYNTFKAELCFDLGIQSIDYGNREKAFEYVIQGRKYAQKSLELSRKLDDAEELSHVLEILAISYVAEIDDDFQKAKYYAQQSKNLGNNSNEINEMLDMLSEQNASSLAYQNQQSSYQPYKGKMHPSSSSGSGCYVATAVYGAYDCPQVWTLRRYRDNFLSTKWYGRLFIRMYYAISPTLVKKYSKNPKIVGVCRKKLDKIVTGLLERGFSDKPYTDQ